MIEAIYIAVGVLFTAAALLALYRIVRGPTILDRVIASDVLLTTLILVVGAEMVYNGHTRTVPMMLVMAATAIFGTISVARYVSKHDGPGSSSEGSGLAGSGSSDGSVAAGLVGADTVVADRIATTTGPIEGVKAISPAEEILEAEAEGSLDLGTDEKP